MAGLGQGRERKSRKGGEGEGEGEGGPWDGEKKKAQDDGRRLYVAHNKKRNEHG